MVSGFVPDCAGLVCAKLTIKPNTNASVARVKRRRFVLFTGVNRTNLRLLTRATLALVLGLMVSFAQTSPAQSGTNPLTIFKDYLVTGDYVVAGWVEQSSDGTYATGTISVPDPKQQPYLQ